MSVIKEMLNQRGYTIVEEGLLSENGIDYIKTKEKVCVLRIHTNIDINKFKEYIKLLDEMGMKHGIIIYENSITSQAKNIRKEIRESVGIIIEFFSESELRYNITKHEYVPKFTKLSPEKSQKFKEKYGTKFAILRECDPISKFYFYQKGDIVMFENNCGTVGYNIVR